MGLFSKSTPKTNIKWIDLVDLKQLESIKSESENVTVVILKHSTRCSISLMAKNRLDTNWDSTDTDAVFYYLDLLKYRDISNTIAQEFNVIHESPQVLVIKNGKCSFSATHGNIDHHSLSKAL